MERLDPCFHDDACALQRDYVDGARLSRAGATTMKLGDVGEDRLLEQLLPKLRARREVILGPGDDCALVDSGKRGLLDVLKTDCLVEEIHFAKTAAPELVGWKAMARPLSDFAAMSALPQFALVTLIVPSDRELGWVQRLYRGIEKPARRQFPTAKTTNYSSRSRRKIPDRCRLAGGKNSRESVSRGLAASIDNRKSIRLRRIENSPVVMFISKSVEETIAAGRRYGGE